LVKFDKIRSFWSFWGIGNPLSGCVSGYRRAAMDPVSLSWALGGRALPGECRTEPPQTPRGPGKRRDGEASFQPSLRDFSPGLECTQDFILGYFQPELSKLDICDGRKKTDQPMKRRLAMQEVGFCPVSGHDFRACGKIRYFGRAFRPGPQVLR
jgi:hypothetical protein